MRALRCGWLAMTLLGCFAASMSWAQDRAAEPAGPEPQVVRVRYVEGDVRVSRGRANQKLTHAEWEQAAVDLPLESGYSLVTGAGRAQVEFEDASIVYLAENSVLVFNDLESLNGVPQTQIALLSGTMALHATPSTQGEGFEVRTPTDRFTIRYPESGFVRMNSFLDGVTVTALGSAGLKDHMGSNVTGIVTTASYRNGQQIPAPKGLAKADYAEFDSWVRAQDMARSDAMQSTMKEAGLKERLPGLPALRGQGHFYACPPYGTCWEPTSGFAGPATEAEKAAMARQTVSVAALAKGGATQVVSRTNVQVVETEPYFPCSPFAWQTMYQVDPVTGRRLLMNSQLLPTAFASGGYQDLNYLWAVCHSGNWVRHEGRYAWVVGTKKHPHPPIHWVKTGNTVGYVPVHPGDVKGKPPLGLHDGIMRPVDKQSSKVQLLAYSGTASVKVLEETPKAFLRNEFVPLQRAEAPHVQAFAIRDSGDGMKTHGTDVSFDHKTQSFMVSQAALNPGSSNSKMMQPIGGRGSDLQANRGAGNSEMMRGAANGATAYNSHVNAGGGGSPNVTGGASHASAPAASAPPPMAAPTMSAPAASSGATATKSK